MPASAAKLEPTWLEALLCRDTPGAAIEDIRIHGGSDGTNTRRALSITYKDAGRAAGLPRELFVKSATRGPRAHDERAEHQRRKRGLLLPAFRDKLDIEVPRPSREFHADKSKRGC